MSFPASPSNGQTAIVNNIAYTYASSTNTWTRNSSTSAFVFYQANSSIVVSNSTASTSTTTGALQVNGGVGVGGNITVGNFANVTYANIPGSIASGGVYGLTVGVPNPFYPSTTAAFNASVNNYTQLTIQNLNSGSAATSDFIATADNGSDTTNYIDLGIINSQYNNSTPSNSLGNIVYNGDGYLYAQGNLPTTFGGNLAIGTTVSGRNINLFAGGVYASNIVASVTNTGFSIVQRTSAMSSTTGALTVSGGAGIGGALYVGSTTPSTNNSTGAVVVSGGVGVQGNIYTSGSIYAPSNTNTGTYTRVEYNFPHPFMLMGV